MKVIIFYGTDCNESTAWIPWLKEELNNKNIKCIIPNLPTPENQDYSNWSNIVDSINIEKDDIIVGWSTGAIFAVRYLYENKKYVKKLILISGFNNYVGNVPSVDNINKNFFMQDLSVVSGCVANEIVCIKSDDDPFITQEALNKFAEQLEARIVNIVHSGHFNLKAGFSRFIQLLEEIK